MRTDHQLDSAFKRQVVFRISADGWPLLQAAVEEHGSIQAAVLAGLQALQETQAGSPGESAPATPAGQAEPEPTVEEDRWDPDEVLHARAAAVLLDLKASTVRAYISAGRMPGFHDETPGRSGWYTTRGAVEAYRPRLLGG